MKWVGEATTAFKHQRGDAKSGRVIRAQTPPRSREWGAWQPASPPGGLGIRCDMQQLSPLDEEYLVMYSPRSK